eukprot:768261-Hanusia_phi.AAC.3
MGWRRDEVEEDRGEVMKQWEGVRTSAVKLPYPYADPLMCAAKALEQNSQAEDVGGAKTPARMQELSQYYLGDHGALSSREVSPVNTRAAIEMTVFIQAAKDFDSFFDSLGSNQDEKHSSRLHASVPQKHAARQQQHRRATSTMRHSVHRAASNPVQMTRAQTSHAFVPSHVANDKPNHTAQQLINRSDIKRTSSEVHTETPRQPEAPRKPVRAAPGISMDSSVLTRCR